MITDFVPVPDWPGEENVDGGLAVGDLDGDGIPELVVFVIDSLPGDNAGRYRVGRGFDATGTVTGEWGPWQQLPDWPFFENAGGGIALVDLDGSGALDMVVAVVDAPEGPNTGFVRVGRNLDVDGVATGGWGPWQQLPDWGFLENVSADCAVADVNGDGRPELVLLTIEARPGQNAAFYRWARLAPDGTATDWAPWTQLPEWPFDENAGCGVAVGDLDGDGTPELLVLAVDAPDRENAAHHSIGWRLDGRGRPTDGWGPWQQLPSWPFWENQGGAATLVDVDGDGVLDLVVLAVDNPIGRNAGFHRVLDVVTDLAVAPAEGVWRLLEVDSGVLAVHAALLPTGSVLFFAGSSNDEIAAAEHRYGTRVWHYPGPELSAPTTPVDLFCCGHATLPDGRLLAAGGTQRYDPFHGLTQAVVFDPAAGPADPTSPTGAVGEWQDAPDMASGRWYPTLVSGPDGDVLAVSGLGADGQLTVVPERFRDRAGWTALPTSPPWPLYAHLFLLVDGRVFYSGGQYGANNGQRPSVWDPDAATVREIMGLPEPGLRNQAASVLLPPAQDQRVMIVGGGGWDPHGVNTTTATTAIVDLTAPDPVYVPGPVLHHARMHLCAVLLPDRTVVVCGGSGMEEDRHHVSPHAEIYHPDTNTWRGAAASRVPRLYHSVALLMPDGKVVTAGSNPARRDEERRIEVFWPPYLFAGPRPQVTPAQVEVHYGEVLTAEVPDAALLGTACLIRPGATTHSSDSEQRLVDVPLQVTATDAVELQLPTESTLAPPGWYLLFVATPAKVPSEGQWVHLS